MISGIAVLIGVGGGLWAPKEGLWSEKDWPCSLPEGNWSRNGPLGERYDCSLESIAKSVLVESRFVVHLCPPCVSGRESDRPWFIDRNRGESDAELVRFDVSYNGRSATSYCARVCERGGDSVGGK